MSTTMFRRAFTGLRMTLLSYAGGVFFYGLMIALFFPSIRSNSALIDKYLRSMPEALVRAIGIQSYSSFPHFMGGEYLNLIWPIIAAIFVVLAGSSVVAQEIEQGTIDLWLSVPVTRARLLAAKLAAIVAGVCILAIATDLAILAGARLIGEKVSAGGILALSVYLVLFPLTAGAFAAAVSSLSSTRGRAAGITAAALVLSYLVWVASLMSSSWSWLGHLSVFSLFHPQDALADASLRTGDVAALAAIIAIFAATSLVAFQRRPTL